MKTTKFPAFRFHPFGFQLSVFSLFLLAILLSKPASAATVTWLGNTDANWATDLNWSGGTPATNSLIFNVAGTSGTTLNNDLTANSTITGITFSATSSAYTLGGSSINLTGAITNSVGLVQTLNFNISGNGSIGGSTVSGGQITLAGDNSFTGGVTNSNQGRININSATALGASSSVLTLRNVAGGAFDNTSGGPLTLTNANNITLADPSAIFVGTYSLSFGNNVVSGAGNRTLQINASTLTIGSIAPTVASSTWTKSGAGTLAILNAAGANLTGFISNGASGTLQIGNDTALGSGVITFTAGALEAINGDRVLANTSTLGALTVSGSNNVTFNGKMTGLTGAARTLTNNISSGNVLTLADVDINTEIANTRNLTIAGTGNTTITGTIASGGNAANGLIITNTGVTTLSGNNTYTGVTTVSAGTLDLGGSTATGSLASTSLALGGGTFAYTRTGTNTKTFTSNTTVNAGASAVTAVAGNSIALGTLTRNVGGTVNFGNTGNITTSTANDTTGILGGYATYNNNTWAVGNGASSAITGLASYVSDTWAIANNTDVINSTSPGSGNTTNSLRFNTAAANTVTLAGNNTITSGGILVTSAVGSNASTITGGTLVGANTKDLVVIQNNTAGDLTIASNIANNTGATGLTKSGAGTLTLTGTNTYTGNTTVNAGILKIGSAAALGGNSSATSVTAGAVLDLNGTVMTNNNVLTLNGNGISSGGALINSNATAGTYAGLLRLASDSSIMAGTGNITLSNTGTITGATFGLTLGGAQNGLIASIIGTTTGTLTKQDAGTWTLTGNNTYSGATSVNSGTLSFNRGNAIATVNQTLGTNARVNLGVASTSSGMLNYTGGTGTLAKNINVLGNGNDTIQNSGAGVLTLSGNLTKHGTVLTLKGGNGINVTGVIAGSGANSGLIVDGGTTTLSNANTYNGPTSIINGATMNANVTNALPTSNGRTAVYLDQTVAGATTGSGSSTLALGANQSISSLSGLSTSGVNLSGNTLTIGSGSGSTTFAGAISGSGGSVVKDTAGSTQILSGNNTYTGTTTVSAGALLVSGGAGSGLTATSGLAVSGGTLQLGASNVLNDAAGLTFSAGIFSTGATAGFSETLGTLDLNTAATLTLALGTGVHSLNFADSHLIDWTGSTLTITGWTGTAGISGTAGKIFFGNSTGGLTSGQLSQINFAGYSNGAIILSTGEITAVPEPTTWALLAASLTTIMALRRRRASN